MGLLIALPASGGEGIALGDRGRVRSFPASVMQTRDARMFERIVAVTAFTRSPLGLTLRIRASADLDALWLDDLAVAVHARHVGQRTGGVAQRLDRDLDPADIRLQIILGNPKDALRPFIPDAIERIALVSRGVAARVFPLSDLPP